MVIKSKRWYSSKSKYFLFSIFIAIYIFVILEALEVHPVVLRLCLYRTHVFNSWICLHRIYSTLVQSCMEQYRDRTDFILRWQNALRLPSPAPRFSSLWPMKHKCKSNFFLVQIETKEGVISLLECSEMFMRYNSNRSELKSWTVQTPSWIVRMGPHQLPTTIHCTFFSYVMILVWIWRSHLWNYSSK